MTSSAPRRCVLGLDIGGTKLAAGVIDSAGELLSWQRTATPAEDGPDAVLSCLIGLGIDAVRAAGLELSRLDAIGIACGGPLDCESGIVVNPPNLPGWLDVEVTDRIGAAFALPTWIDNDGNASLLGEARFGAARGARDVIFMTISTGVGGGAISGGRIVRGASGNAAELGHLCVVANGRRCGCGARGCVEAYASGTSIAARAREAIAAGAVTSMATPGDADSVTAERVIAAARKGDELAVGIWNGAVEALAMGIASSIHAFNPEMVVLGGGVTKAADFLFEPLRRRVAQQTMPAVGRGVRIVAASLGDRLGVYGAAAVALERLESEEAALAPAPEPSGSSHERRKTRRELRDSGRELRESGPVAEAISEHLDVARDTAVRLTVQIEEIGELLCASLGSGGRLIAFGNGGSASDAQHFAAELIGHYKHERGPVPAIALTTDSSVMTGIANDYCYADVFARQVEALAGPDDVVVGITTSGNSQNVVRGLLAAGLRGAATVALTGGDGGPAARIASHALIVPSYTTSRIQEMHALIIHMLSEKVDSWAAERERIDATPAPGEIPAGAGR